MGEYFDKQRASGQGRFAHDCRRDKNKTGHRQKLPDDLSPKFIHAVRELLSGLVKIEITSDELRTSLLTGGSPATIDELKERFDNFLREISKGKET